MLCEVYERMIQENTPVILPKISRLVIVVYFLITLVPLTIGDTRSELRKHILSHYNRSVSPGFETLPSDVGVIISRTRIVKLDELASTLSVEAFLHINWYDIRLNWENDLTFNNISWISANADDVWKPKMNIFNNGRGQNYGNTEMPIFIRKNGMIWRSLMGEFHFICVQEDLRWYPLDSHDCKLSVGPLYPQDVFSRLVLSWNKTFHGVDRRRNGIENTHWKTMSLDHSEGVTSVASVMFYPTDDFTFKVRRQGWPQLATFLPLLMSFMILSWTSFALPPRGALLSKRMAVSSTSLFLSSVFLLVLIKTIPGIGSRPPVIVKVYASVVFLEFFTCLHNVIMANILPKLSTHLGVLRKLPKQVQCILGLHEKTSVGGKGLLANEETPQDADTEQLPVESGPEDSSILVGTVYDRVHVFLQVIIVILVVAFLCCA